MELSLCGISLSLSLLMIFPVQIHASSKFQPGPWKIARATFYGGPDGSETFGNVTVVEGACGYGDLHKQGKGYGLETAALSKPLFNEGAACGACYEIKCDEAQSPQGCKPGAPSIIVTATNLCPPGGWCSPPQEHFDLSQPAYLKMAEYKAGVVPVQYRRVPCVREGGIRFTVSPKANPHFLLILVSNVGGAGDVKELLVRSKGLKKFTPMKRNWGQYWEINENLGGQDLTFRVITSDGRSSTLWRVLPQDWQIGKTYEGKKNIR